MLSHLSAVISLNLYSVCTLIPAVFFLVMAILFFSMKGKSKTTLVFGLHYLSMFVFFFGYFAGTSIDHPAAAYYRYIVVFAIYFACFSGILFVHFYPGRNNALFTRLAVILSAAAAIGIISWYAVYYSVHNTSVFNFESHSWEFSVSASDMAVSLGVSALILCFLITGMYRVRAAGAFPKRPLALIVIIIFSMTLCSSLMSALSKTGAISRGSFFLVQDFLDIAAYFSAAVIYINATKDRSSFMTKIIGITMVTFLLVFQVLSYIAIVNKEKSYNQLCISAAETASYTKIIPDGMSYLSSVDVSMPPQDAGEAADDSVFESESIARKSWVYEQIRVSGGTLSVSAVRNMFAHAGSGAEGYARAVDGFIRSSRDATPRGAVELIDRIGNEAQRMSRKMSLYAPELFPEKAYELFRGVSGETAPLYRAAEEKVQQLGLRGENSRKVMLAMLYPMKPSGSSRFLTGADGRRYVEFHVIPPDNSLRIAGFDYLGYRSYISPMAREYCTLLAIISVIILIGFRFFFFQAITHPLKLIEEGIDTAKKGDLSVEVPVMAEDEIGLIARTFNAMIKRIAESESNLEGKVADRTVQLEDANRELTSTLNLLKSTQEDLVRREKMAALGDMVAGIAHEINTPVGVALTAGTYLSNRTAEIRNEIGKGNLSRSGFDAFIASSSESAAIITSNLTRAAELVNSFKKVAVAQTSGELSEFKLAQYLHDLMLNLRPALKRTKIQTVITCGETLTVTTYAGAISQIVTNLVMNSIKHGFDHGSEGTIRMTAEAEGESLLLRYSDSGKGIPAEIISKIFDPFFTTARSAGGTGLGLHIVYNLVTQKLQGSISAQSAPGEGTTFVIRIPRSII